MPRTSASHHVPVFAAVLCMLPVAAAAEDRGWAYLIAKLDADGIPRVRARSVLHDRRVPAFTGLSFNIEPREPSSLYRGFRSERDVAAARGCRERYGPEFRAAERRFGVPASVLAAILHVETYCGRNTGKHVVLHRLARLAMANEPANVRDNIARHTRGLSGARAESVARRVRLRAQALEDLFYPEVLAVFRLAKRLDIHPLSIRGSPSGAFGLPQFLPSSYLRFAVDGDGDGKVSLYQPADAIASAANYLRAHGWEAAVKPAKQREVIWAYNRSDAYIDTILFLAERIERTHPSRPMMADSGIEEGERGRP
jgi:membrane-bound lytic murein transglycosylase B